jgi:hypothetical protein
MLSLERDCHQFRGLSLSSSVEDEIGAGVMTVVPGRLDEDPSHMNIAGLGDATPSLAISA